MFGKVPKDIPGPESHKSNTEQPGWSPGSCRAGSTALLLAVLVRFQTPYLALGNVGPLLRSGLPYPAQYHISQTSGLKAELARQASSWLSSNLILGITGPPQPWQPRLLQSVTAHLDPSCDGHTGI